jgi:hypothetical protein
LGKWGKGNSGTVGKFNPKTIPVYSLFFIFSLRLSVYSLLSSPIPCLQHESNITKSYNNRIEIEDKNSHYYNPFYASTDPSKSQLKIV